MISTECSNCGGKMSSRKPSKSGASFCREGACQNAKQRFYRQRWKTGLTIEADGSIARRFVKVAMHDPRVPCPTCGLQDAVSPYIHRDLRQPDQPCFGVGGIGPKEGLISAWVDIVHPELAEAGKAIIARQAAS